jgi:hypothetical protein
MAACAPLVQHEEGNVTISLPGGNGGRAIADEILNSLVYRLAFSGPNGESRSAIIPPGARSVTLNLNLGGWTVRAEARLEEALIGTGEARFTVRGGGGNSAEISMHILPGMDFRTGIDAEDFGVFAVIPEILQAGNQTEWNNALNAIKNGGNDKNYILTLTGNFSVSGNPVLSSPLGSVTGITISLRGDKTLTLSGSGALLLARDNQNLVLRESALVGNTGNNMPLVYFGSSGGSGGGSFTMHSGKISGNTSSSTTGGGVFISWGGSFTMKGGDISGNSTGNGNGGGVYISDGSFTMTGGKISSNSTGSGDGGGVAVSNGSFTMEDGEISGNSTTATGGIGGGVYVYNSSFTMHNGKISDNTSSTGYGGGVNIYYNSSFMMTGGEISGNSSTNNQGGGVAVMGGNTFTMEGGEIFGTSATDGGGVYANGSFTKTGGGTIYGDDDGTPYPTNGNATDNTAKNGNTYGHAVYNTLYKYRDSTAGPGDDIDTGTGEGFDAW